MDNTAVRFADPTALDPETVADCYADLDRDDAFVTTCDEHRDAWIAALEADGSALPW